MNLLQSWRANCDVKILIYDTHPDYPDLSEISKVSDYIVSYTCKGHMTLSQEKNFISSTIKTIDSPCHQGKHQVQFAAKQLLNSLSSRRVIGQAETHHSTLNLPLTLCSEDMFEIRISGWRRLKSLKKTQNTFYNSSDFLFKYFKRTIHYTMSLWQYFHHEYNTNSRKKRLCIPYASGLNSNPTYPITTDYARGSLLKHHPWSENAMLDLNCDDHVKTKFQSFLKSRQCPPILILEYKRAKSQYHALKKYAEPTNTNIDPDSGFIVSNNN